MAKFGNVCANIKNTLPLCCFWHVAYLISLTIKCQVSILLGWSLTGWNKGNYSCGCGCGCISLDMCSCFIMEQSLIPLIKPCNYPKWKYEMNKFLRVKRLYSIVHGIDVEPKGDDVKKN